MKRVRHILDYVLPALLFAVILTSLLVNGLFARYTAGTSSGDSARVAKFNGVAVAYDYASIPLKVGDPLTASDTGNYVFRAAFTVSNTNEVSCTYELTLSLRNEDDSGAAQHTVFAVPSGTSFKTSAGTDANGASQAPVTTTLADFTGSAGTFTAGSAYFRFDGGTWAEAATDGTSLVLSSPETLTVGGSHTWEVLYFVSVDTDSGFENSTMAYRAVSTQVM